MDENINGIFVIPILFNKLTRVGLFKANFQFRNDGKKHYHVDHYIGKEGKVHASE